MTNTTKTFKTLGYPSEGFRSKSWNEFADGPEFDLIFTVCDSAAAVEGSYAEMAVKELQAIGREANQ